MGNFTINWAMSFNDLVQTIALIVTIATFIYQLRRANRDRRKADEEALRATKIQIYQTLEIESNSIFRFEAEHKYVLPYFKSNLAPAELFESRDIKDKDGTLVTEAEMKLTARKYYELTCNLFEVASRLRKEGVADAEVFGSWVAWYFDTLLEWGFRAAWGELRDNYTSDLRQIFDPFVEELIGKWDRPHARGTFKSYAPEGVSVTGSAVAEKRIETLKKRFYADTARLFGREGEYEQCAYVRDWLENAAKTAPKTEHPMAYA